VLGVPGRWTGPGRDLTPSRQGRVSAGRALANDQGATGWRIMQKAHCHDQEYWVLKRTRCRCGSMFDKKSITSQRLQHRPTGPVDVLDVRCSACGEQRTFEFDISAFFGKVDASSFQELRNDERQLWQMFVWHQCRMEGVLKYLSDLADDGDTLAISYVAAAVSNFLEKAKKMPAGTSGGDATSERFTFQPGWKVRQITVEEAERENPPLLDDDRTGRFPHIRKPFGFLSEKWEALKAQIQPGDELWEYESPAESWQRLAGRAGIVLLRRGVPVAEILTRMN